MSYGLTIVAAQCIHPYFTASPFFPDDPRAAWEDGKRKYIAVLTGAIKKAEAVTIEEYCRITGSNILEE